MDIIVGIVLAAAVGASVKHMISRKKKGKMLSCGCDCGRCPASCDVKSETGK